MSELVKVEMPDGQIIWANVRTDDGIRDVGLEKLLKLTGLTETLRTVATSVRSGVRAAAPDEVSVEFGVELALADDGLVAALAGVSTSATLAVTLSWRGNSSDPVN